MSLPVASYPDIFFMSDDIILKNPKLIESLEECIMEWERYIQKMIDLYTAKTPSDNGPVAEYEYWHEREAAISVLVEQLKKSKFLRICTILEKANSQIYAGFEYFRTDLKKFYVEARDNVKFLSTVLRHFKVINFFLVRNIVLYFLLIFRYLLWYIFL